MTITNNIIKGVSKKLYNCTKYPVYVNKKMNNVHFPCFFIRMTDNSRDHVLGVRYLQTQMLDIWYLPNAEEEIIINEVHELAESLYTQLEYINCGEVIVRGTDMNYRITDGGLHFFVTYEVFLFKEKNKKEFMKHLNAKGHIHD